MNVHDLIKIPQKNTTETIFYFFMKRNGRLEAFVGTSERANLFVPDPKYTRENHQCMLDGSKIPYLMKIYDNQRKTDDEDNLTRVEATH